jgi:hypothetical protein
MFSRSNTFWAEAAIWLLDQTEYQKWWGDQMAVAEICKREKYHILLLPAVEFNWTPLDEQDSSGARIWHYKGEKRKKWIEGSHLVPNRPSNLFELSP